MSTRIGIGKLALALVAGAALGGQAHATLGGDAGSVATNQQHLGAALKVDALPAGERHELRLASGIVVHEYVSPAGKVYAIAWHGGPKPDLLELLGDYFGKLSPQKSRQHGGGHHHASQVEDDFVFQSSGHRNAFSGRAWVPSLVPAGIDPQTSVE